MNADRTLLYITPVIPSFFGNGLAMRAAQVLRALSTRYRVTLLVLTRYGSPAGSEPPASITALCDRHFVLSGHSEESTRTHPDELQIKSELADARFEIVHLFRLGTVPLAEPWLSASAHECWLDLDDVESVTHRGIARLHRQRGEDELAVAMEEESARLEQTEIAALQRFDRIFLASADDADRLPLYGPAEVVILPNVLPLPQRLPPTLDVDPFRFLFVGTLGYFPNWEGVAWFIQEIWPIVSREAGREVEFQVVGSGGMHHLLRFRNQPGLRLIGFVDDLTAIYRDAGAVVVPLRAGGGTRIKVIEAFGLGRPVISTTIGVDGIGVTDRAEALLADDPRTFSDACIEIASDPRLRANLTECARLLAESNHSVERLREIINTL